MFFIHRSNLIGLGRERVNINLELSTTIRHEHYFRHNSMMINLKRLRLSTLLKSSIQLIMKLFAKAS